MKDGSFFNSICGDGEYSLDGMRFHKYIVPSLNLRTDLHKIVSQKNQDDSFIEEEDNSIDVELQNVIDPFYYDTQTEKNGCVKCDKLFSLLCGECTYKWCNPNRNGCGSDPNLNPCDECKEDLQSEGLLDENGVMEYYECMTCQFIQLERKDI